jgi:hypothetical protein
VIVLTLFFILSVAAFAVGWMPREHHHIWRRVWLLCFVALVLGAAAGAW